MISQHKAHNLILLLKAWIKNLKCDTDKMSGKILSDYPWISQSGYKNNQDQRNYTCGKDWEYVKW